MWRWIVTISGILGGQSNGSRAVRDDRDMPPVPTESSGTPEDSPVPNPQKVPAKGPVPDAPAHDEVNPARFPYPVPAPSRNGTHTSAHH